MEFTGSQAGIMECLVNQGRERQMINKEITGCNTLKQRGRQMNRQLL